MKKTTREKIGYGQRSIEVFAILFLFFFTACGGSGDSTPTTMTEKYTLTLNENGWGSCQVDPPGNIYEKGTQVTIVAVPDEGWELFSFDGDQSSFELSIIVKMDSDKTINANFWEIVESAPTPVTVEQQFDTQFPQASNLNTESLTVMTMSGSALMAPKEQRLNKTLPVWVSDNETGQIAIIADGYDKPLFFAYFEKNAGTVYVNAESIAKALIWMNPFVMILPADQKAQFLDAAVDHFLYSQLILKIETLLVTDPSNIMDPDTHPEIVKTAFTIVKSTYETLSSYTLFKDFGESGHLRILEEDGNYIGFENPKMVAYGIQVSDAQGDKDPFLLEGKPGLFKFGIWPPVSIQPPMIESYYFSDGQYYFKMYKGFNTDVPNWYIPYIELSPYQIPNATITGTATWHNGFALIDILVDTLTGDSISSHLLNIVKRIARHAGNIKGLYDLAISINSGDPVGTLDAVVDLLQDKDNWRLITKAMWDADGQDAVPFLKSAKALIKNIAVVLKGVTWANHHIPLIYDMGFAPWKVEYCVEQQNGILNDCSHSSPLIPPVASLTVNPTSVYVGDTVTFDASGSYDDNTLNLEYRYDFDGDSTWDQTWSGNSSEVYIYRSAGNYNVRIEVRDADGLTAIANHYLMVYDRGQAVSTALIIDRSGSMSTKDLTDAKNAATSFVNFMGSADRACVISFDQSITINQDFTENTAQLYSAINSIVRGGLTAFHDSVYVALSKTNDEPFGRRKAVIAMTDGFDNSSLRKEDLALMMRKLQDVVFLARQYGIPVYTIGLGSSVDQYMLTDLANQTNALYFRAPDSSDLKNIYDTIAGIQ